MVAASAFQQQQQQQHHDDDDDGDLPKSLIIPITSNSQHQQQQVPATPSKKDAFIEIFPEEIPDIPSSVLSKVLRDEDAPLSVWADAALMYVQQKHEREGADLLTDACELEAQCGNRDHRVRVLASAGIAHLTQASRHGAAAAAGAGGGAGGTHRGPGSLMTGGGAGSGGGGTSGPDKAASDQSEELRGLADQRFTHASKVDQLFPMTWVGRGMLNLSAGRIDQARFFFETTLKQCGQVLPALLGMAAVKFADRDYKGAQDIYAKAITLFPQKSGAATRVGFGLACYKLGQIDRAKAAFKRAHEIDPDNVEAMVGIAILDMASLDKTARDFRSKTENAVKMLSMANLVDHSNAMVQNHLANHYFWKWTPVPGVVSIEHGSDVVSFSQPINLDPGEKIRIGHEFETHVAEDEEGALDGNASFKIRDVWKGQSVEGLKLWRKDYDRVVALAKGAYNSTTVQEMQAESLLILARVFHVKGDMVNACKFYDRACKLAPDLSPARFGLSQTLICEEHYEEAAAHLRLVLGTSSSATDALALLGLLEVKAGKDRREALTYLKKAIDIDPLSPDLVLLEALALQQHESDYPLSLERYRKAVKLMEDQGMRVPYDVLTNMGVLCHETKQFDEALKMYTRALKALDEDDTAHKSNLDDGGDEGGFIRHPDNDLFWNFVDTNMSIVPPSQDGDTKLTLVGGEGDVSTYPIKAEDHIRIGDNFQSEIVEIGAGNNDKGEEVIFIRIKDTFVPPSRRESADADEDGDNAEEVAKIPLFVKRGNRRLHDPLAISVAFNLARLHEAAGRIIPAVELHKAIVRRHPSYVNSYLRLACIARDCGSLKDCSEWLKSACAVAPGNPEVLTLVGNLHLSLCDWAPAQSVFDQLLAQKEMKNVEAYSLLSLGNIYFNNLKTPKKYSKHLQHAADFYRRILNKDKANAYAANGLGTVLAEKGELFKAKEIFNRVREVSGDTILDTLLNLGHIYLAQKKHPEALQMYQSYMTKTRSTKAPITSKSQDDDEAEILLYIAFAYFDWARQAELYNDARAAPADERYKKCIEYIEQAMKKSRKENLLLRYNWCMTKLQAANCVLQKLTRNIRRTAQEVQDALNGLEESLPVVQTMIQWKSEGKRIPIASSTLNDFVLHCKQNIESAKSHLSEELKRESEARELRELQRMEALTQQKEREMELLLQKEREAREQEERENKARAKMYQVMNLRAAWEKEEAEKKAAAEAKKQKRVGEAPPGGADEEDGIFDTDAPPDNTAALFDEDSDDEEEEDKNERGDGPSSRQGRNESGDRQKDDEDVNEPVEATEKDLFGESSDESDEELVKGGSKREHAPGAIDEGDDGHASKKRRVIDD